MKILLSLLLFFVSLNLFAVRKVSIIKEFQITSDSDTTGGEVTILFHNPSNIDQTIQLDNTSVTAQYLKADGNTFMRTPFVNCVIKILNNTNNSASYAPACSSNTTLTIQPNKKAALIINSSMLTDPILNKSLSNNFASDLGNKKFTGSLLIDIKITVNEILGFLTASGSAISNGQNFEFDVNNRKPF